MDKNLVLLSYNLIQLFSSSMFNICKSNYPINILKSNKYIKKIEKTCIFQLTLVFIKMNFVDFCYNILHYYIIFEKFFNKYFVTV